MNIFSIGSGSSGNSVYIGNDDTHILIDAGLSAKRITGGLCDKFIAPEALCGIFITHEHMDHIKGLSVFLKKNPVPVYATEGTLNAILEKYPGIPNQLLRVIHRNDRIKVGTLIVSSCPVPHDAADPVCYSVTDGTRKISMATDLGYADESIWRHLANAEILYLESNYDRNMLLAGAYPLHLKQRIMSDFGHLSNDDCVNVIRKVKHEKLKTIILAHLSEENNFPMIAYQTMKNGLMDMWDFETDIPEIIVAERHQPIPVQTTD